MLLPLSPLATAANSIIFVYPTEKKFMGMCMRVYDDWHFAMCPVLSLRLQFIHFICLFYNYFYCRRFVSFLFPCQNYLWYNDINFLWDDFHFKSLHDIIRFDWSESFLTNLDEHLTLMRKRKKRKISWNRLEKQLEFTTSDKRIGFLTTHS